MMLHHEYHDFLAEIVVLNFLMEDEEVSVKFHLH